VSGRHRPSVLLVPLSAQTGTFALDFLTVIKPRVETRRVRGDLTDIFKFINWAILLTQIYF